jgi:CRP-like cAMP-binding protein
MGRAGLPPELRMRLLENFYDQHVTRMGIEDRHTLAELPKFLQHEVAMYLNRGIVSATALFRGCSPALVASVIEHIHAHRCLPLDQVIYKGEVADELYLIKHGLFEVLNEDNTVHRMLGNGSYFGEIALLCRVHRTMSVRAVTMGLVFVVERQHFLPLLDEYPADRNQMLLSAALRYRTKAKPGYVVDGTGVPSLGKASASVFSGTSNGRRRSWNPNVSQRLQGASAALPQYQQGLSRDLAVPSFMKRLRRSISVDPALINVSDPLAFLQRSTEDIENLKFQSALRPISTSPAEKMSVLRDAEIVASLRQEASKPKKMSIEISEESQHWLAASLGDGQELPQGCCSDRGAPSPGTGTSGSASFTRHRMSTYALNRAKLEEELARTSVQSVESVEDGSRESVDKSAAPAAAPNAAQNFFTNLCA